MNRFQQIMNMEFLEYFGKVLLATGALVGFLTLFMVAGAFSRGL